MDRIYSWVYQIPCISLTFTLIGPYYSAVILKESQQSETDGGSSAKLISYAKEKLDKLKINEMVGLQGQKKHVYFHVSLPYTLHG